MCTNLEQVQLAKDFHAGIQETCCKGKDAKGKEWQCPFFVGCLYQAQFPDNLPDVFIVAHQMMFHAQKRFGEFAAIGIDALGVRRGLKSEYFIFTDPLIILAGAILLDRMSDLRFHRWAYVVGMTLFALHIAVGQAEPAKYAFKRTGPESICQWNRHYMPLLPPPWCPPRP